MTRVLVRVEGNGEVWGLFAEALGPNWFDKNPALSKEDNLDHLRASLRIAVEPYIAVEPSSAVLDADYIVMNSILGAAIRANLPGIGADITPELVGG